MMRPSPPVAVVPETWTQFPMRTAREYPTADSHCAPLEISCRSIVQANSVGKGWRTFVEVFQVRQDGGGNALRRWAVLVEPVLQAVQDQPEPAWLGCSSGAVLFRIWDAFP